MKARFSAFTLIELLVVIVIIGIITVIAAPDYFKFKQKIDLKNSINLLQAGFNEGYSLARSRSKHYLVTGQSGNDFYQIKECDDYLCTSTSFVKDSKGNPDRRELEGNTLIATTTPSFEIKFLAPHGDMKIITPTPLTPPNAFTITLDNKALTRDLNVQASSGLVTTDTP